MADRITDRHLDGLCAELNKLTGSPAKPYARNEAGRNLAQVGNYHISSAYGGVTLHRISNESGGVTTPLHSGYVTKRDLYERMQALIEGMRIERTKQSRAADDADKAPAMLALAKQMHDMCDSLWDTQVDGEFIKRLRSVADDMQQIATGE